VCMGYATYPFLTPPFDNCFITCPYYLVTNLEPMLDIEFKYYRDNYSKLVHKYENSFLVIKGKKILGVYKSHSEAFDETIKHEKLGTFLIQHCVLKKGSQCNSLFG